MSRAKKNKKLHTLKKEFDYYHKKVEDMEKEREHDRSWESKELLKKYKKTKLALKTQIAEYENSSN